MAITKEKKQQMVADYLEKLGKSKAVILTDYRGLTVGSVTDLRAKLRDVNGGYQVVKNTLFLRALEEVGIKASDEQMNGPMGVGFCYSEVPPVVKALLDFAKETEILQVKGAFFGQSYLDEKGARALADLPPRAVILGQLLGAVQGPMSALASVLAAPLRELVQVIKARSEQAEQAAQAA